MEIAADLFRCKEEVAMGFALTTQNTTWVWFHFELKNMAAEEPANLRILVEKNPSDSRLSELNFQGWPKWGCGPGKYQLKYDAEETCYLLRGKVKAYPKGSSEFVEFGAGDIVIFPKGLSCTWDVSVAVDKHYKFDSPSASSSS